MLRSLDSEQTDEPKIQNKHCAKNWKTTASTAYLDMFKIKIRSFYVPMI